MDGASDGCSMLLKVCSDEIVRANASSRYLARVRRENSIGHTQEAKPLLLHVEDSLLALREANDRFPHSSGEAAFEFEHGLSFASLLVGL